MGALGEVAAKFEPAAPLSLLDGRLTIGLPAGARIEPRPHSIMAAPAPLSEETRAIFDANGERLVLMAFETFLRAGPDFGREVAAEVARWGKPGGSNLRVSPLPLARKDLEAIGIFKAPLDLSRGAVPVADAFVRHPDGAVQRLELYVDPGAAKDAMGCGMLAFKALATLAPGPRALGLAAGTRTFASVDGSVKLEATAPEGYVQTKQVGPDFVVHVLRRLAPFAGGPFATLGVYLGGHPGYHHAREKAPVEKVAGQLFGKSVDWFHGKVRREAIVDVPGRPLRAHVFYSSDDPALVRELEALVSSLKLEA